MWVADVDIIIIMPKRELFLWLWDDFVVGRVRVKMAGEKRDQDS